MLTGGKVKHQFTAVSKFTCWPEINIFDTEKEGSGLDTDIWSAETKSGWKSMNQTLSVQAKYLQNPTTTQSKQHQTITRQQYQQEKREKNLLRLNSQTNKWKRKNCFHQQSLSKHKQTNQQASNQNETNKSHSQRRFRCHRNWHLRRRPATGSLFYSARWCFCFWEWSAFHFLKEKTHPTVVIYSRVVGAQI